MVYKRKPFLFSKNCVTLREEAEWVELIEGGFNVLVGSDINKINEGFDSMSKKQNDFSVDLYGKGQASRGYCFSINNT